MAGTLGLYVRVSRRGDREDERFHSPKEQTERAAALAVARGYVAGPVFEDIDVSGATAPADRPAMAQLLERIEAGELAGVAAYSLDRLSREPGHGDELVKRITRAGGVVLTPDIPDAIDSPTGEFTFGMLLQVAKLYRSQAKARWASAVESSVKAGIPVGRTALGYRRRDDRRIELDPESAQLVRECYERRAGGAGWYVLADLLTERTGRRWTVSGARELIRNPLYKTGRLTHGDIVSEWDAGAIIDEALWAAAQGNGGPSTRPSRSQGRYLLSGLVRCASCGYALNPTHKGHHRRNARGELVPQRLRRLYVCRERTCTAKAHVKAELLEEWVVRQSFKADAILESREAVPDAELVEAVETAARRLEWVTTPEAVDALGPRFATTARQYREAHDEALRALGEARASSGYSGGMRLEDAWDGLSPVDRRAALGMLWKEIRVGRRGENGTPLTFVARGPLAEAELELPNTNAAEAA